MGREHIPSYIDVIAANFPTVSVSAPNSDGADYDALQVQSPDVLPTKDTLDALIKTGTKENIWTAIKQERDMRTSTGGYKVGTNWYHSDQASRTQQIALVLLGANLPNNVMWKTMSGTFVLMTPTLASQIFQTAVGSDQATFARAEQHRAALNASETPETYDFGTGWPQTYQESIT